MYIFFHGYKIICHDVQPESKSVCRLQCWHLSSLIQEPEAAWCESKQQVMILTQDAWMLARNGQVDYILSKQLTNHHHLLSIYDMANIGDTGAHSPLAAPFHGETSLHRGCLKSGRNAGVQNEEGKSPKASMPLFILLSLKHGSAPLDQFSAFFSSVKDSHLQRWRAQIQEFPGG